MYILDILKQVNSDATELLDSVAFEYRLLCSGELYNANVITADWRKSDVTRLLASRPFLLTVCSHPFNDYPQELSLRFKTTMITETKGRTTVTFYPDEEIARDLSSILSLILRRLITVSAKVREIHPRRYDQELDYLLDNSTDFVNRTTRDYWARKPATIIYGAKGIHDIIDYNPPPLGVDPQDLLKLLTKLASSPCAESLVLAARLYSQALRQIEHEADLAYQSFISCVETIANQALQGYHPEESEMVMAKKAVFDKAAELGLGQEQCREIAIEACSGMSWTTKKFTKFLVDNAGKDLWEKDDLFQLDPLFCPKQGELQSAIRSVYKARGGATHKGRPYPPSISIGIGPTVPIDALLDLNLDPESETLNRLPPIAWFERLVNSAILNFIRGIPTSENAKQQE
jgi:hypothetical protein